MSTWIGKQSDRAYFADTDRVSNSMLCDMLDSPYDFYLEYIANDYEREEPTSAMKVGSAVHSLLLGGDEILLYPDECLNSVGGLIGKRAKEYRDEHPDAIVLKKDQHKQARRCARALQRHEDVGKWIEKAAHKEVVIHWDYLDVPMRAKLDIVLIADGYALVVDLKCTDALSVRKFKAKIRQFKYWLQMAHYSIGVQEVFDQNQVRFLWLCADPGGHNKIAVHDLTPDSRAWAIEQYENAVLEYSERVENNDWSEAFEGQINQIDLLGVGHE